jgi:alpha-tubulin suppressor-like RCC1 family protein
MKNTIAGGGYHSLGLRTDGKVIGWGDNMYGKINCPDEPFIAIAAGGDHSLGLRADGKVFGWVIILVNFLIYNS